MDPINIPQSWQHIYQHHGSVMGNADVVFPVCWSSETWQVGDEVTKDEPLTTNPNVGGFGQAGGLRGTVSQPIVWVVYGGINYINHPPNMAMNGYSNHQFQGEVDDWFLQTHIYTGYIDVWSLHFFVDSNSPLLDYVFPTLNTCTFEVSVGELLVSCFLGNCQGVLRFPLTEGV